MWILDRGLCGDLWRQIPMEIPISYHQDPSSALWEAFERKWEKDVRGSAFWWKGHSCDAMADALKSEMRTLLNIRGS